MKPMKTMRLAALSLALLGGAEVALASEVTITAEYRPSSTNARFKNTTPVGGFCNVFPTEPECSTDNHSIGLGVEYNKKYIHFAPIRDMLSVGLPGARELDVVEASSGEAHKLSFLINKFSARSEGGSSSFTNPMWSGFVLGGCGYIISLGNVGYGVGLWNVTNPESPSLCYSHSSRGAVGDEMDVLVKNFSIGYVLRTPNPLAMRAGIYEGRLEFSVGSNGTPGDFDLGNGVSGSPPSTVTLNFVLDVQHAFELQFPANSDKVILEPPGGWMRWLNGGPAPEKLVRDLPFRITKTGPMSVFMECEYPVGLLCGVRNPRNNHTAALDIKMSLPGGLQLHNGQAVERHPIPTGRTMPLRVETETPVFNQPGALHFATAPGEAAAMVQHPGDTYRGNVTVVFDALL